MVVPDRRWPSGSSSLQSKTGRAIPSITVAFRRGGGRTRRSAAIRLTTLPLSRRMNVAEDFRLVYGADADAPRAVALSIDTNDTHAPSEGLIGPILFRSSD